MQYVKFEAGLLIVALAFCAQQSATSAEPSFDCTKARSKIDKMICADQELSLLDKKMSELLEIALTQTADQGDIKKLQRRWLRDRDDCESVDCLKNRYAQRVDALATLTGHLPVTSTRNLCGRLTTPQTRTETLGRNSGAEDINNDGKTEHESSCTGGAANVPCTEYLDKDGRPIQVQPQTFSLDTYAPQGRKAFRHENRTFVYHSRDAALAEPAYLSYITPSNREFRICEFDTTVGSAVLEGGHEVCAAVEANERIEPIEWTQVVDRTIGVARADTAATRIAAVDIDNDGLDESVVELSYKSSVDPPCTFNYFELLTEDHDALLDNSNSIPVRELQGLVSEGYRGGDCGTIENRLFKFGDSVFYETNVLNNARVPHEVRVLDGTAVATLCTLERQVTVKVTTMFSQ